MIGGLLVILSHHQPGQTAQRKAIEGTNFIPSQMFMGSDGLGGLAVNERTHQMCLLTAPSAPPRLLPITEFVSSSLVKNGELIGEGNRRHPKELVAFSKEIQRKKDALIKSSHMESANGSVQQIDLVLTVHDPQDPFHVVNFLDMETKEGGILYEKALSTATHWHNVLDGFILEADRHAQISSESAQEQDMAEATT